MKLSTKLTIVTAFCISLSMTSVSEAGKRFKSFGKINGGSQFKSRTVRRPSTANFHHNFNYKRRSNQSGFRRTNNFKKTRTIRKTINNNSRLNSNFRTIGNKPQVRDLNKNIRKPVVPAPSVKGKNLFEGRKPGQDGRKTIMPVDPRLGVHKPRFPRPGSPIFCPPGRRPIVCLPPIRICPPVVTPCVVRTCPDVVCEQPMQIEEEIQPALQMVVGQSVALEAEGLGANQGQVMLEVNGLGMPIKVLDWKDDLLMMELPMMALPSATNAMMHLIDADGQPLASVPVELLMEAPAAE